MFVRRIQPVQTHDLRLRVLRDNRANAVVVFPGDDDATTFHLGAFDSHESQSPLAIASCYLAPMKDQALACGVAPAHQHQFRGMASDPKVRGRGYADAVMRSMIEHVRALHDSGEPVLLWCNARTGAVGFYERFTMRVVSAQFEIPEIGPHVVMTLRL